MSEMNRREMCAAAAAFALLGEVFVKAQRPPGSDQPNADMSSSRVFHFDQLPAKQSANGGWSRAVVHGKLPTGEFVEVHQTMLPAGKMPHPAHKHSNSEFVLIREGTVEYLTDGKRERVGPGDVVYTASEQPHGMINVGNTPAMYFVVSVGVQPGSTEVTLKPAV